VEEITGTMLQKPELTYEIILVNDSSPDDTWEYLRKLADENEKIIAIDFSKNFGQHNALLAGFSLVRGKYIMTSDDDGQTPVSYVFDFIDKLEEGYDVVSAKYDQRAQPSLFRRFGTFIDKKMSMWMLKQPRDIYLASFFLARRFIIDEFCHYKNPYPYITGLILQTTNRIGNVVVENRERASGNSGYNFEKLFKLWINGLTTFSIEPLRIANLLGVFSAIAGLLIAFMAIVQRLVNPETVLGWTSLIATVFFVGGVILIVLGMIGEYIGRIYVSINNSPQYIIRSVYRGIAEETEEKDRKEVTR